MATKEKIALSELAHPMLSVEGVTKLFDEFAACSSVDFDIKPGEIHALLGENGAGKSTLVKMLYGALQPSSGVINWEGKPVSITSPAQARALGVGMVFQHFSLFEALSVAENIALSLPGDLSVSEIAESAEAYGKKYGLPLNANALVGDLSVGERQRVEIIRCLLQDPKLLILDEPTSVLTPQEADKLFETINLLKDEGRAILFISHRLEEVRTHCDRATILRFGKVIANCDPKEETVASLASMMVGGDVDDIIRTSTRKAEEPVLSIKGLNLNAQTQFSVSLLDVNLGVKAGEIVGIAGIAGNGQSELFEAICGERLASTKGQIKIGDTECGLHDINLRRKLDAAFIPEERNGHGAIATFPLSENLLLTRHTSDEDKFQAGNWLKFINRQAIQGLTSAICTAMDVRKSGSDPYASSLSGGNLQKFIMGRELDRRPKLVVVNQPSWGVDAGAAQRIRQALIDLAENGSAVLMISQDLDEIFQISDRIAVLFEGTLSEAKPTESYTRETIGLLMAGVHTRQESDRHVA